MGENFTAALKAIGERTEALNLVGDEEDAIASTFERPSDAARKIMSGFVPTDDTEAAVDFAAECAAAMLKALRQTPSSTVAMATLMTTVAQLLAVGVALEREVTKA